MSFNIQNFSTAGYGDITSAVRSIYEPASKIDQRSYESIYHVLKKFRQTGKSEPGDIFDTPSLKFFKIFFDFGDIDAHINASDPLDLDGDEIERDGINSPIYSDAGLLIPTFLLEDKGINFETDITDANGNSIGKDYQYYRYNSAWAYLKNNGEEERAMLLKYFITLLSDISSNYPWYFPTIEGLDQAVNREIASEKGFMLNTERPKITIKCLQDAVDDRIGTLLDLYRAITYSWASKREILPANLRKFNMSIYVFEAPMANVTKKLNALQEYIPQMSDFTNYGTKFGWIAKDPSVKPPKDRFVRDENNNIVKDDDGNPLLNEPDNDMDGELFTSYKLFEFHNCEIDYNTTKTALATLDNTGGIQPAYELGIYFDDCYEHRLNSFHGGELGDMLMLDTATVFISSELEYMHDSLDEKEKADSTLTKARNTVNKVLDDFADRINVLSKHAKSLKDMWCGFGAMADGAIKQIAQNGLPAGLEMPVPADATGLEKVGYGLLNGGLQGGENMLKGAALGNLHGFSLTDVGAKLDRVKSGDVSAGVDLVMGWAGKETDGATKGKVARQLTNDKGEAQFNLRSIGTDYKNADPNRRNRKDQSADDGFKFNYSDIDGKLQASKELGSLGYEDGDYNPSTSKELGKLTDKNSDYNQTTTPPEGSFISDKSESELIEENIHKTKLDKYNEENKITNINSSNRNHKTEMRGYEVSLIGDNPQSKREAQREELISYNLKDSIKNESDYREMDRIMKGTRGTLIGGTMYDDLGSQMVEKDRILNETIRESTDYRPNVPKLGGSFHNATDYNPFADNGKNIGSRTMRNENDYKAELKKRKMNNLAQSMISNI